VLLYRLPEPRKQACKEETRTSNSISIHDAVQKEKMKNFFPGMFPESVFALGRNIAMKKHHTLKALCF
jgi:hypothetical protein